MRSVDILHASMCGREKLVSKPGGERCQARAVVAKAVGMSETLRRQDPAPHPHQELSLRQAEPLCDPG